MTTLTVTVKGQIPLRKDLLAHLDVRPRDKITVAKLPDDRIEAKAVRLTGQVFDVFGFLKRENEPSLSIDEMNEIAAEGRTGRR